MALPLYTQTLTLDSIAWTEVKVPTELGGGVANGLVIENTDETNSVKRRTDKDVAATEITIGPMVEKTLPPVFAASRMPINQVVCYLQASAGAPVVKVTWF